MKKIVYLLVVVMAAFVFLSGCAGGSPVQNSDGSAAPEQSIKTGSDFRSAAWGMTMEEVILTEGAEPDDRNDVGLLYSGKEVAGMPATVYYSFKEGKLVGGMYSIKTTHTDDNLYIEDYNSLKEALTTKYGTPGVDTQVWIDDLWKDDPSFYGFAVSRGSLQYVSSWNDGHVGLNLYGDNNEISLSVIYQSDEFMNNKTTNTEGL